MIGMTKSEAQSRIRSGEFSWDDIANLLKAVAPKVKAMKGGSSKIAKGVPSQVLHNLYSRVAKAQKGRAKDSARESIAVDVLREFGTPKPASKKNTKRKK